MREKSALHKVFRRLRQYEKLIVVECGHPENIARSVNCKGKLIEDIWAALEEANRKGLEGMQLQLKERR